MVINNAILWELNELVGNLRPELHTHIRLIMLRADYLKETGFWKSSVLKLKQTLETFIKCWQSENKLQPFKRAEDVRVKFNVIKKLVDSNPSYATLFISLKDIRISRNCFDPAYRKAVVEILELIISLMGDFSSFKWVLFNCLFTNG